MTDNIDYTSVTMRLTERDIINAEILVKKLNLSNKASAVGVALSIAAKVLEDGHYDIWIENIKKAD